MTVFLPHLSVHPKLIHLRTIFVQDCHALIPARNYTIYPALFNIRHGRKETNRLLIPQVIEVTWGASSVVNIPKNALTAFAVFVVWRPPL